MGKYNIKIGSDKVSPEIIKRHQNFDAFLGNYQDIYKAKQATKPLYKNYKLLGLIIIICVLLLVIFLDKKPDNKTPQNNHNEQNTSTPKSKSP